MNVITSNLSKKKKWKRCLTKRVLGKKKKARLKRVTSFCCWFLKGCELTRWCFSRPMQLEANARTKNPESALNDKTVPTAQYCEKFTSTGNFNSNWCSVANTFSYNCSSVDSNLKNKTFFTRQSKQLNREWLLLSHPISLWSFATVSTWCFHKTVKRKIWTSCKRGLESCSWNIMT